MTAPELIGIEVVGGDWRLGLLIMPRTLAWNLHLIILMLARMMCANGRRRRRSLKLLIII